MCVLREPTVSEGDRQETNVRTLSTMLRGVLGREVLGSPKPSLVRSILERFAPS